jgi:hypothetical protein
MLRVIVVLSLREVLVQLIILEGRRSFLCVGEDSADNHFCRLRSSALNDGERSGEFQMSVFECVRSDKLFVKRA